MSPLPGSVLSAAVRWLWNNLDGPAAVRTSRLCIFGILIALWVGAYWAVTTRTHIEHRLDEFNDARRARDAEIATLDGTISRFTGALEWMRSDQQRMGDDVARLNDRVARTEGQLDERGRRHE